MVYSQRSSSVSSTKQATTSGMTIVQFKEYKFVISLYIFMLN